MLPAAQLRRSFAPHLPTLTHSRRPIFESPERDLPSRVPKGAAQRQMGGEGVAVGEMSQIVEEAEMPGLVGST